MLLEDGAHPMSFRLSRRLVSAAGQTMRWTRPIHRAGRPATKFEYEITVSTTLLFNTFQHLDRRVTVGGLECRDRLEALQRIFEHELLHLAEFLGWGRSNCRAQNFHRSRDGSSPTRGRTTTWSPPASRPAWPSASSSVTVVGFEYEGMRRVGHVIRITRRATVLVEDPAARLYSDGRRYLRFYVPLELLRKV